MRTEYVRIMPYGARMINPAIAEALAHDHQLDLWRAAERSRLAHATRVRRRGTSRHVSLRTRAGWWMVHAGIRLALTGDARAGTRPIVVP